jgi:hypothetical protein
MNEKDVKKAFDLAQKEVAAEKEKKHEEQVQKVKDIVKRTLEEIEKLKDEKSQIDEKLKILKLDIDDLKQGKLERVKERQDKDPQAKKVSVFIIEKVIKKEPSPWYWPWIVRWNTDVYPIYDVTYNNTGVNNLVGFSTSLNNVASFYVTNSSAKDNTIGAYTIEDKTVNLR